MVDRPDRALGTLGYLQIDGIGGYSARDVRGLLKAFEDAYEAVARVELAALRIAAAQDWLRRRGPPARYWPDGALLVGGVEESHAADPLIVSRVVLQSPGFWEFLGSLNPLEVLRRYLIDRHERC